VSDSFDFGSMLAGAMEMQQRFDEARASIDAMEFIGSAGGNAVAITVTGNLQILDVTIAPAAVDPNEVSLLEDMVMASFLDALSQIDRTQQELLGQFQMPDVSALGDLGSLGDLGGLLSGGVIDIEEPNEK